MAELSSSVIHKFVDLTSEEDESKGYYSYATGIVNGNDKYVQLDGSDTVASVSLATDLSTGDRVLVYIENHTATVVGNITYPTSGRAVIEINENLLDFEELTVGNFAAIDGQFETIETNYISAIYEVVDYLLAEMITADYILAETIEANYATIYDLTVLREYVDSLEASEITVEYLEANFADINKFNALEGTVTYLESQMITTDELEANYAKIADLNVTNANVTNLEADYSDLKYVLAGYEVVEDLQSIHLTSDNVVIDNAVIQDAMIANISADKITAGTIYTSLVKIQTAEDDTSLYLNDSLIQMCEDNLVRFQAGKDATGEYGLYIWNSEGKIMFDATGATSDGIGKEVIVNDMVADTANIAGYKLDIASVAERLNEDGSLTIEAAQVTINGSTLDAWYAEVTETTTDLGTNMSALQTQFTIVQGQVETVVSQTEILEGEVTSLSDKYAEIIVNVDSVTTQVKDLSSDYDTLTGEYTNLTSQVASIETTVNQVDITVSSLTSNYDTLAENVASLVTTTDSITASVSSIEEQIEGLESGVSEEAVIEILKNNITLQTTSSTNGTASIILSVDGDDVGDATVVDNAAEAFESEVNNGSKITITGGSVIFNSNTIEINSSNFTLDSSGNVTARSMTVDEAYITDSTAVNLTVTGDSSFEGILYAREIHLTPVEGYSYGAFLLFGSGVTDPEWEGINPITIGYTTNTVGDTYTSELFTNEGLLLKSGVITKLTTDEYFPSTDNEVTFDLQTKGAMLFKSGSEYISGSSINNSGVLSITGVDISTIPLIYAKNSSSSSDAKIVVESYSGYSVWFGVGSGGSNRGIYDSYAGAWLVYKDSSNNVYLGTSTVGSGTKPIYLNSGKPTASSSTVGSSRVPVYLNSGTLTSCSVSYYYDTTASFSINHYGSGYITNSGTTVNIMVGMSRIMYDISSVTVTSKGGCTLRQGGNYTSGSSSSSTVNPSSYTITAYENMGFRVRLTFSSSTNVTNNASIGVAMGGTTLSFS